MLNNIQFFLVIFLLFFFNIDRYYSETNNVKEESSQDSRLLSVPIGVVVDMKSMVGSMADVCIKMAISDFYSVHPNYTTRLQLHTKNVEGVVQANFAALELVKQEEVVAILGAIEKPYAAAAIAGVPILSFTERGSSIFFYFVTTTLDDAVQAQALAAICELFEWPQVVILYQENEADNNHFLSHLINALQDVDIGMTYMIPIPASADDSFILEKLSRTKMWQSRVFLVLHMSPVLGARLFTLANTAGMMGEGYAWIITDSLSVFLTSIDSRDSMDGVLGIRPYVFPWKNLQSFQERWKSSNMLLNIYGLWAYDAVTALAIAVENIRPPMDSNNSYRISSFCPKLINELPNTRFRGLTGDFQLVEGKLKSSPFEIFNLVGNGERSVGFWTPERGITRDLRVPTPTKGSLRRIFWPGDTETQPRVVMTSLKTENLRIGVPWTTGFPEFIHVKIDPTTNATHASGFAIDIFLEAWTMLKLPCSYTFHIYNGSKGGNWTYDDMLKRIPEDFDMVVGDTTIWAPRASYVDFSLPYSESGVVLVVKNKKPFDMWIFIRPLRGDLWVAIIFSCILMAVVLRILEHRTRNGPHSDRAGAIYLSPISVLAFQERDMVTNKWSVFVLVCWLFMAYILMQSFTANLSAILTLDQLKFSFSQGYTYGYHENSFIKKFLMENLSIPESRLRPYSSIEDFHDAMNRGSKNGGIEGIFDEIPYMKLFLNRYESQYKIVGPTYRTDGLGFAFKIGSSLTAYFSRAILNVTQGPKMDYLERKNFGPGYSSPDSLISSTMSQGTSGLALHEFAGLFLLTGSAILFALFCSETAIGRKITDIFVQNCFSCGHPPVESMENIEGNNLGCAPDDVVECAEDAQVTGAETQSDAQDINVDKETVATQHEVGVGTDNQGTAPSSTQL